MILIEYVDDSISCSSVNSKGILFIDAAKKLAKILDTTVGYLLGENDQANLFKDPKMLQRFQDISVLPDKEKECLLTTVDHFIKASKISLM